MKSINLRRSLVFLFILHIIKIGSGQNIINEIPQTAFDSYANMYNYTYWDSNFKTNNVPIRTFTNQTSSYALNIDFTNLEIETLDINSGNIGPDEAFLKSNSELFPSFNGGNIDYAVLQADTVLYAKSNNPTSAGNKDSQMSEYGTWLNRRFCSTQFTNNAPVEPYFTGIEFTNWHNRFKVTYHLKPTEEILDGKLMLSIEIPIIYSDSYQAGSIYAFADSNDAGFATKGGITAANATVSGNTITVTTAPIDFQDSTSYELSIIFYAIPSELSTSYSTVDQMETSLNITTNQTLPDDSQNAVIVYAEDEGLHFIDIPKYNMGYNNCSNQDKLQNIKVSVDNPSATDKVVRMCFRQIGNLNIVGFNSIIRNANGDPSGYPLQVSKNWHGGDTQLYSGNWSKEYVEIPVPANTTINFDYTRTGAKWGNTYGAFSHQLSVVGAGIPRGGWLEAGLGSFGENVTHSPDYAYGNSNVCDVRPFLVTNQAYGYDSQECFWTGNVGGMDMCVYDNDNNARIYQSQIKTRFQRYSPNLTETSISTYSSDNKLKFDYTFYLNRSDDFTRVYYKVKIKALENIDFSRFDFFQMGSDTYNFHDAGICKYGDTTGVLGEFDPNNNGSNDYTTEAIALTGEDPWIWAGDGQYSGTPGGINMNTNNGIIIRSYQASFDAQESNVPYFRERSSSIGFSAATGNNPTSYCLVPPPTVSEFMAGDSVELILELAIFPKQAAEYYGTNTNFATALTTYGNSVELFLRELNGNSVEVSSTTNDFNSEYPISVTTNNNTANVTLKGGTGYIPIRFTGLSEVTDPSLWRAVDTCWELVDQSYWGKDFWQTDYNTEIGLFELVYNVNQDALNDSTSVIKYYLGLVPPSPEMIVQTKIYGDTWTIDPIVEIRLSDSVIFAPQINESGIVSPGDGTWEWSGPNNYSADTRAINFEPATLSDVGVYLCIYTDPFGCSVTQDFEIKCLDFIWSGAIDMDWNLPGNWVNNELPNENIDVRIPNGVINFPSIDTGLMSIGGDVNPTSFSCRNLLIESNALITFKSNTFIENRGLFIVYGRSEILNNNQNVLLNLDDGRIEIKNGGEVVLD